MNIDMDFERESLRTLLENDICLENDLSIIDEMMQNRFIRAFGSASIAYDKIIKYFLWRKEFGVDSFNINDSEMQAEQKKNTVYLLEEFDKSNRPVMYIVPKNHIYQTRNLNIAVKYAVYMIEQACEKCNGDQDQLCLIFDLNSFSFGNVDYAFVRQVIHIFTNFYPERLGVCLVINYPYLFLGIWTIIKQWLNEHTIQKIIFCKSSDQICAYVDIYKFPSIL